MSSRKCGTAGLGKTTLAHVAARHCGFRPVEINASDERSAGSLTSRINDAVQMQAVMADKRPNCVVIDEIDGATGEALRAADTAMAASELACCRLLQSWPAASCSCMPCALSRPGLSAAHDAEDCEWLTGTWHAACIGQQPFLHSCCCT